jgi:hypothetical protein
MTNDQAPMTKVDVLDIGHWELVIAIVSVTSVNSQSLAPPVGYPQGGESLILSVVTAKRQGQRQMPLGQSINSTAAKHGKAGFQVKVGRSRARNRR